MRILLINVVCGIRSTGRICTDLASALEAQGHEVKIAYGREEVPEKFQKYAIRIGTDLDVKLHCLKTRLFDDCGFGSKRATEKFIEWVKQYDPDVIHLHNLHGYYINIEVLFNYLKSCKKQIIWSFYDCWAFTGHCAHYDYHECTKWMNGCCFCKYANEYPKTLIAHAKTNYKRKSELFSGIPGMRITVPSQWLKKQVELSFFKNYPIQMIPNGIDLDKFHRTDHSVKEKLSLHNKFVILGVSTFWTKEKGLEYFNRLAEQLDPAIYSVVLAGTTLHSCKIQANIVKVGKIDDANQYYSMADVFVNPTLQETQGLTTVEALACGTPAIVFNSGGAAECISDDSGIVVDRGDYEALLNAIKMIKSGEKAFKKENCRNAAEKYGKTVSYESFIRLYNYIV